jgi:MoxR-like ATPase
MGDVARTMPIATHVRGFASRLVMATHPEAPDSPKVVRDFVRYGASPRGAQALVLAAKIKALLDGSTNVAYDDICAVARPALRHRIVLNFEADVEGVSVDRLIDDLIEIVPRE